MANVREVYRCEICGNIVEVLHGGVGQLVCCGQPMTLLAANTVDAAVEKHVPVIEKSDNTVKVTVGATAHPMTEEHYIEWIELLVDGQVWRQTLKPGDAPDATFCICIAPDVSVSARAYCNLHGLWKGE